MWVWVRLLVPAGHACSVVLAPVLALALVLALVLVLVLLTNAGAQRMTAVLRLLQPASGGSLEQQCGQCAVSQSDDCCAPTAARLLLNVSLR